MKHLEHRKYTVVFVSIAVVCACGGACIQRDDLYAADKGDAYQQAVYEYVNKRCQNLSESQRDEITKGNSVREIAKWPLQEKLHRHRLFVFPRGANFNRGAMLVAVSENLLPFELHSMRDINELLQKEGIRILEREDALEVGEFFLRCYGVSNVFDYGYESGVNVVRSVEDIQFERDEDKVSMAKELRIEPPKVTVGSGGFHYILYSWDRYNSGRVERQEITIDSRGIQGFKTTLVKAGVGKWEPYR